LISKGDGEEKERVIYVMDQVKIQKFDEDGNFLDVVVKGSRERLTMEPCLDIEIDKKENLYIVWGCPPKVHKFDKGGELLMSFGEDISPYGIAIDKEGNLYITIEDHQVQKFTPDGRFILSFGKKGKGEGEFENPYGIAIDNDGNVYVVDVGNHRIQKFTKDGNFILSFGEKGKGEGEFENPYGIAIDNDGNIYVVDIGNNRIQKFTKDGKFILSFGKKGKGPGEFDHPSGITIDNDGNIYVADSGNHRIQKFTKDGNFLLAFGEYLEIDPHKVMKRYMEIYVTKKNIKTEEEFEKLSEEFEKEFAGYYSQHIRSEGKFCCPLGIAVNF
jgi:DNA-binding beta-propeller fold protein YncE